jgi:hypothetical protein
MGMIVLGLALLTNHPLVADIQLEANASDRLLTLSVAPHHYLYFELQHSTNLVDFLPRDFGRGQQGATWGVGLDDSPSLGFFRVKGISILSPHDADRDGMDDLFELEQGLDPLDPADASLLAPGADGLTWFQAYHKTIGRALTSWVLIERAQAEGGIDAETALIYQVYAAYGDPRLPEEYRGDDEFVLDSFIGLTLVEEFDRLSPQAQAILAPFLLPPSAPGSWVELQGETAVRTSGLVTASSTVVEWGKVAAVGGKIKVWYQKRYAGDDAKAEGVAKAIDDKIWPKLTAFMPEPFLDGGLANNGGDPSIDIYLVHITNLGLAKAYHSLPSPAYILINSRHPLGDEANPGIVQTVAHELMHASQFTYKLMPCWTEYAWLMEATAMWVEHHIYPRANSEHPYAATFLNTPFLPLNNTNYSREYGAYLMPFFLDSGDGKLVRRIWDKTASLSSLEALHAALPEYERESWFRKFSVANWNRQPEDQYARYDGLAHRAPAGGGTLAVLVDELQYELTFPTELNHLSAQYYHFTFSDDSARLVTFYNGWNYKLSQHEAGFADLSEVYVLELLAEEAREGRGTHMLYKMEGQGWQQRNLTHSPHVTFCRDAKAERIEELVLIFTNSSYERDTIGLVPLGLTPRLQVSNIGCWRWEGTMAASDRYSSLTADVAFQSYQAGFGPMVSFQLVSGTGEWQISGTTDHPECTYEGEATFSLGPDNGGMSIFSRVLDGPHYRGYAGGGWGAGPLTWIEDCPDIPRNTTHTEFRVMAEFQEEETPDLYPRVGADGTTLQGESAWGGTRYTWSLKAVREP